MKKSLFVTTVLILFLSYCTFELAASSYTPEDFLVKDPSKNIRWGMETTTPEDFIIVEVKPAAEDLQQLTEPNHMCAFAYVMNPWLSKNEKPEFKKLIEDYFSENAHVKKIQTAAKEADTKLIQSHSQTERNKIVTALNKTLHTELAAFQKEFNKNMVKLIDDWGDNRHAPIGPNGPAARFVTLEYDVEANFTPSDLKGAITKDMWHQKRTLQESIDWDVKLWEGAIFPVDPGTAIKKQAEIRQILIRLFSLVNKAGVKIRTSEDSTEWKAFAYPTATLLSRGGRVMVVVKKSAGLDLRAITNWIATGKATGQKQLENKVAGLKHRLASTHDISFEKDIPTEVKLDWKKANLHNNYAMNIALGGYGSEGADGSAIQANGRFGHVLFVISDAPKSGKVWQTGFQVGVEHSEPAFFNTPFPPKSHLGTTHSSTGGSEEMSITNDAKWVNFKEIHNEADETTIPGKYDCMRIEIETKKQFETAKTHAETILKIKDPIKLNQAVIDMLKSLPESGL